LLGLTSLWISAQSSVSPEINHRRAVFVLGRIDEILRWDLCGVRSKQYWRLKRLSSFAQFLEEALSRVSPKSLLFDDHSGKSNADSQATARRARAEQGGGIGQSCEKGWRKLRLCNLVAQGQGNAEGGI
jgi:hypothetical protein